MAANPTVDQVGSNGWPASDVQVAETILQCGGVEIHPQADPRPADEENGQQLGSVGRGQGGYGLDLDDRSVLNRDIGAKPIGIVAPL